MPNTFFQNARSKIMNGINELTWPGVAATATELCHQGIQITRQVVAGPVKNAIKDQFSTAASAVGAFAVGSCLWRFLTTMTDPDVWAHLTNKQRFAVMTVAAIGLGGSGYSIAYFGREQNTRAVGLGFAGSALIIAGADFAANEMAERNEGYEVIQDRQLIL